MYIVMLVVKDGPCRWMAVVYIVGSGVSVVSSSADGGSIRPAVSSRSTLAILP